MELKFDKLVACNIKRLTKPKLKKEFAQFNDPTSCAFDSPEAADPLKSAFDTTL